MQAFAVFDNSPKNLANPDPSKTVKFGEQSWDEMLLGYFDIAVPRDADGASARAVVGIGGAGDALPVVKRIFDMLDKNKDGKIARDEVGPTQLAIFDKLDTDADGNVTEQEIIAGLPELRKLFRP